MSEAILTFDEWYAQVEEQAKKLNSVEGSRVFEVGPSGTLLAGDIVLTKGDEDSFEAVINGVKPGIWAFDSDISEDDCSLAARWISPGPLDFENLPTVVAEEEGEDDDHEWEKIGSYSVDSGGSCLLDKDALAVHLRSEPEPGTILEVLAELEEHSDGARAIPGGLVFSGNDGGYKYVGRKDENGVFVGIKLASS